MTRRTPRRMIRRTPRRMTRRPVPRTGSRRRAPARQASVTRPPLPAGRARRVAPDEPRPTSRARQAVPSDRSQGPGAAAAPLRGKPPSRARPFRQVAPGKSRPTSRARQAVPGDRSRGPGAAAARLRGKFRHAPAPSGESRPAGRARRPAPRAGSRRRAPARQAPVTRPPLPAGRARQAVPGDRSRGPGAAAAPLRGKFRHAPPFRRAAPGRPCPSVAPGARRAPRPFRDAAGPPRVQIKNIETASIRVSCDLRPLETLAFCAAAQDLGRCPKPRQGPEAPAPRSFIPLSRHSFPAATSAAFAPSSASAQTRPKTAGQSAP